MKKLRLKRLQAFTKVDNAACYRLLQSVGFLVTSLTKMVVCRMPSSTLLLNHNVRLEGKTLKGRNKIRQRGDVWTLFQIRKKVMFSGSPGPWWLLESKDRVALRWVNESSDPDFKIVDHWKEEKNE